MGEPCLWVQCLATRKDAKKMSIAEPLSILYDNTTIAVAQILGDGVRLRTRVFSELQSHYLFDDKFGRSGKGNE